MTGIFSGRCYEQSQTHYLYVDAVFGDDGSTLSLGWLPEDAVIHNIQVVTSAAFNAGTTNQIDVGFRNRGDSVADDPDGLAANVDVSAAGVDTADLSSTANLAFTGGGEVTATIDLVGTDATAGAARVVVEYTVATDAP